MKKIMVVDDDKDLLVVMKGLLKRQGYDVAVTTSCSEGLEILVSFKPDLIFLDINVGEDDGRLMCRKIKSFAEHKHIPVILISANDDALATYKDYDATAYLRKPLQPLEVLGILTSHISSG